MKLLGIIVISLSPFVVAESALAQGCANSIFSGGQTVCVRTMVQKRSSKAINIIVEKKLDRMQLAAERDVRRGYDPSVSLSEFRRRLDRHSYIWDAQREHRYSN